MILSVVKDTLYFLADDGEKYKYPLKPVLKVKYRDEVVEKEVILTSTILLGKTGGLSTEELTAALLYVKAWPKSIERSVPLNAIEKELGVRREQRRDAAIIKMTEIYGSRAALVMTDMIRHRRFPFPAYYLREDGVSRLVKLLIEEHPGAASQFQEVPKSRISAVSFAHRCGGSRLESAVRNLLEETGLTGVRCEAAFFAANYVETHTC